MAREPNLDYPNEDLLSYHEPIGNCHWFRRFSTNASFDERQRPTEFPLLSCSEIPHACFNTTNRCRYRLRSNHWSDGVKCWLEGL